MEATRKLPEWTPAVNGAGRLSWFLVRGRGADSYTVPLDARYYEGKDGRLVRYGSCKTAQRAADKLNAEEKG